MEAGASDAPRLAALEGELRDGLKRAAGLPVGGGYVDGHLGFDLLNGSTVAVARLEAGLHPLEALTIFGFVETHFRGDASAGLGARLSWP